MDAENLLASLDVRSSDCHLSVKSARPQNRRVENIHAVRRRHDDDALIDSETIHLNQELVERLLSLIVTAAHAGTTLSGNRIDLIDKDNTRGIFLGFLKQVADTGCADTDEHFNKIRTGNREERNACLTRHRFGKQGFTGSWRSD